MDQTNFSHLSLEMAESILIWNRASEILNMCQVNSQYRDICSDTQFWIEKLEHDYPTISEFIKLRYSDNGYAVYNRFDDGYDGSKDQREGFINIKNMYLDPNSVNYAIVNGNVKLAQRLIREQGTLPSQDAVDAACVLKNATHIILVLSKYKIYPSQLGINWAAYTLNNHFLQWIIPQGFAPNTIALDWIYEGTNNVMNIYENRIQNIPNYNAYKSFLPGRANRAASHGYLDTLQWLATTQNSIPGIIGLDYAATNDHLDVIKWAYTSYGLLPSDLITYKIKRSKPSLIRTWLIEVQGA